MTDLTTEIEGFRVTREKIREFASALGEGNPICHEVNAAISAGYPDLVAPPTFLISMQMSSLVEFLASPDVGLDISQILHGEQAFELDRPIIAGDELVADTEMVDSRSRGDSNFYSLATRVRDMQGQHVATLHSTIVASASGSVS